MQPNPTGSQPILKVTLTITKIGLHQKEEPLSGLGEEESLLLFLFLTNGDAHKAYQAALATGHQVVPTQKLAMQ